MKSVAAFLSMLIIACTIFGCSKSKDDSNPIIPPVDESVTVEITRGSSGEVQNDEGVGLWIGPGTVGRTLAGLPGKLLFSIEPATVTAPAPQGFALTGKPWQLGPEGISFGQRSRISFPVPDTTKAFILGRLNRSTNKWEMVPTLNVPGKPGFLSADVKHFSTWGLFSYDQTNPKAPGRIHFINDDPNRWLSVCVRSYTLTYPEWEGDFDPSGVGTSLSAAGHIPGVTSDANAIVPQGTWTFEVMRTEPVAGQWTAEPDGWIVLDPITVSAPGETGPVVHLNPSAWTQVNMDPLWAPCEGEPDTVFGTGTVQITLTWDDPVDLDLHVIEPNGTEIYFGNEESSTGGRLDRDTICESTTQGKPENIYWEDQAPLGTYEVRVNFYSPCNTSLSSVPFRVRTVVDGKAQTFSGSIADAETKVVTTFTR